jgi:hypothetical protein
VVCLSVVLSLSMVVERKEGGLVRTEERETRPTHEIAPCVVCEVCSNPVLLVYMMHDGRYV